MTPQELAILGTALFLITVAISFFIQWQRKRSTSADADDQSPWDWYDIAELAQTAVKDAEQLWQKEGMPKGDRLAHAVSVLLQAYPQLAAYEEIVKAFIRAAVFDMNHKEPPAQPTMVLPQVLPMLDQSLIK